MKQMIKHSFGIALSNWTTLLLFELLYKVVCYSLVYALSQDILNYALKAAGISYLSFENARQLITSPLSVILLLALLFFITIVTFFELSALYIYCEKGWSREQLPLRHLIKYSAQSCWELLHVKTLLFFWGFMLTVLIAVSPFSQHVLGWVKIPEFITDFITQNKLFLILSVIAIIILNFIFFLYLFTLPSILLFKKNVRISWKEAVSLINQRKAGTICKIIISFVIFFAGIFVITALLTFILAAYCKLFYPVSEAEAVFRFLYKNWETPAVIASGAIGTIWLFSSITVLFHDYRGESRPVRVKRKRNPIYFIKRGVIIVGTLLLLVMYSETELGGNYIYPGRSDTQIIAHRAGAVFAPENTIAALNQAIEDKADAAEIDVQQLKDGTLVIMHDNNFKRTTGNDKNVWDATFSEMKNYDAGSSFSPSFSGEPVPTLEDMLKHAKNKINLMIELKLTGHEQEGSLEKQTLELIKRYDMLHQCTIASMNLQVLEKIKELEPRIETVYITPLLYSRDFDIDYIDGYSLETTSLSIDITNAIRMQDKKVYGWTANSDDTIDKNLRYRVNGIITDNPLLTEYYIESRQNPLSLDSLTKLLF